MADEPSYDLRYCAFVDILGFRELIGRLKSGEDYFERLRLLLAEIHKPVPAIPSVDFSSADFRAQSISDAVEFSTEPTRAERNRYRTEDTGDRSC